MGQIRILSEEVARQIAAGEVVERPASVVKELIENAIDAGASAVTIKTAGAGIGLIEVRDDGYGMTPDDVRSAPKSFSTSKISSSKDLFRIETYGFRGEALASISAVSRFELVSSADGSGEGWKFACEGKKAREDAPAPHARGTTVRVEDLFFNTPARKKFLKSELTERRRILETVLSFALILPQLEIHYSDDDKPVLDLVATTSWRDRTTAVLGSATMKHMVDLDDNDEGDNQRSGARIGGFVSLPTHTRSSRSHQFIYVNRRLVREKTILQAVHEAYRSVIPYRRFPVVVLSLDIPVSDVDVNVHPNKLEVRLEHPRHVFDIVNRSLKGALSSRSERSLDVHYTGRPEPLPASSSGASSLNVQPSALPTLGPEPSGTLRNTSVETYREKIRDAYAGYMKGVTVVRDFNPQLSLQTGQTGEADESGSQEIDALAERVQADEALFWQFNNAYIFIQVRGGIVVIDQHAAHERIIYDNSRQRLERDIPVSQQILFPIHLELSLPELEVFRSCDSIFRKLGFHLEPFGGKSILVRGYPQGLKNWEEGKLLLGIFDDILNERVPGTSHTDRIIASFACRSAVKAGQKLSVDEMKMLADQLFATPNPYSCPHGRPTIQRIALEEIESWFLRR